MEADSIDRLTDTLMTYGYSRNRVLVGGHKCETGKTVIIVGTFKADDDKINRSNLPKNWEGFPVFYVSMPGKKTLAEIC